VKLTENEEDDWHREQFEGYTTCASALMVCGIQNVNQVLEQHLTVPEEKEEEVAEHKVSFFDALKGLEAARTVLL
jgi:hypothetical protein